MIIKNSESIRLKCEDVKPEEVKHLIDLLEKELEESGRQGYPGIGLAAPQLGIPKKIAIVRLAKYGGKDINLVNCEITKKFNPFLFKNEGCLSFPDKTEDTIRYNEILVENNAVEPKRFIALDLEAVVCQHEIDHWNGKLFFDYKVEKPKQKTRPNDLCSCGSGKKFKKCCKK